MEGLSWLDEIQKIHPCMHQATQPSYRRPCWNLGRGVQGNAEHVSHLQEGQTGSASLEARSSGAAPEDIAVSS